MLLGNDIVDLKEPGAAKKSADHRFLERVFTPSEQACIAGAPNPDLALWMLWSGKESTFKIARKLDPGIIFSHRHYAFGSDALAVVKHCQPFRKTTSASMFYQRLQIALHWTWNQDYVHCVAGWFSGETCTTERLKKATRHRVTSLGRNHDHKWALSEREEDSVYSAESREARILAKMLLADQHQLLKPEIVRKKDASRFLPPVIWDGDETAAGIDLSLSHDGRFVAAVISI